MEIGLVVVVRRDDASPAAVADTVALVWPELLATVCPAVGHVTVSAVRPDEVVMVVFSTAPVGEDDLASTDEGLVERGVHGWHHLRADRLDRATHLGHTGW